MAKWKHSDIIPYFSDKFGTGEENCLPYLPEEWKCSIQGKNEEIDILNSGMDTERRAGTINLLKKPGLKTWKIDCFFAHPNKPEFAKVKKSNGWTPTVWVEFFESAMYDKKVLEMTVTGINYVGYVTVENFEHSKKSGEEMDTYYTIDLKEYFFTEIKKEKVDIKLPDSIPPTGNTGNISVNSDKVVDGGEYYLTGRAYKGFSYKENAIYGVLPSFIFTNPLEAKYDSDTSNQATKQIFFYNLPITETKNVIIKKGIYKDALSITGAQVYEAITSCRPMKVLGSDAGIFTNFIDSTTEIGLKVADTLTKIYGSSFESGWEATKLIVFLCSEDGIRGVKGYENLAGVPFGVVKNMLMKLCDNSSIKTKYKLKVSYSSPFVYDKEIVCFKNAIDITLYSSSANLYDITIPKGTILYCNKENVSTTKKGEYSWSYVTNE